MSLRAILFDAGNTLVYLDFPRLAAAVSAATGVPLTGADLSAVAADAARRLERGNTTDRERASRYLEALFSLAGVPDAQMELVRDTLLALHRERHLFGLPAEGTLAALQALRAAGYRLGVVSNSDGRVHEALAAGGLLEQFEVIIDSQLVGVEKPDPRIFALALAELALPASDAIYLGDIYEVDVVGARAAGLDVVLVDPHGRHAGRDVPTVRSVADWAADVLETAGGRRQAPGWPVQS